MAGAEAGRAITTGMFPEAGPIATAAGGGTGAATAGILDRTYQALRGQLTPEESVPKVLPYGNN